MKLTLFENRWFADESAEIYGDTVEVSFRTDAGPPSDEDVKALKMLTIDFQQLDRAVLKYAEGFLNDVGESRDINCQDLSSHFNFDIVEMGCLAIPLFRITGSCDWDEEHGFTIVVVNSNIMYCGPVVDIGDEKMREFKACGEDELESVVIRWKESPYGL